MLSLSARVSRGPNKGRALSLARNRRGKIVTALDRTGTDRVEHDREDLAARHVALHGHGAYFSADGRGAHAAFHKPRRQGAARR
jgi:hypothetical protein